MTTRRWRTVLLCGVIVGSAFAAFAADDANQVARLTLSRLEAEEGVQVLRTFARSREVDVVDARTLEVRDTPEGIARARTVLALADSAPGTEPVATARLAEDSVLVRVDLERASAREVLQVLRTELRLRDAATHGESRVLFRDTVSRTATALERIRELDAPAE